MKVVIQDLNPGNERFTIEFSKDELVIVVNAMQQYTPEMEDTDEGPTDEEEAEMLLGNQLLAQLEEIML